MRVGFILLVSLLVHGFSIVEESTYPERERSAFQLIIEGIDEESGEIRIAMFDSKEAYDEKEDPIHAVVLEVDDTTLEWNDDDLPYGNYAIAVYHDKNTNGELDTNLLGIPKEAYGFSNNARGRFGPASWSDAHFKINSAQSEMVVEIK